MLKNHSITTRNYAVTYYQTLVEVGWPLRLEKPKNWQKFQKKLAPESRKTQIITINFKNLKKNCTFHQKTAKFRDVKTLNLILLTLEAMQ